MLLDNSIKHKKPQLSYLNLLRPPNATTTNPSVIPTPEPLIIVTAENNQREQALLLTEDEGNALETSAELNDASSLNVLCYNKNSWTKTNLSERKSSGKY